MRFIKISVFLLTLFLLTYCGSGDSPPGPNNFVASLPPLAGANVLQMTVNGSLCAANSYINKPCVSIQVCAPGTTNCQTINDILVDTGSNGLRVFKSALTVPLTQVMNGSQSVAECTQYGDGSSDWGPVQTASLILGTEPAVQVPIQVIDYSFVGAATACAGANQSPAAAGYNGILGVGLMVRDCGATCATKVNNSVYFNCTATACTNSTASLTQQVQNPVSVLPTDNNGVVIELPAVPLGGISGANGYLVLGIGTQSNNTPSGVSTYPTDTTYGEYTTSFNGQTYSAFTDTGSNGLYFPGPSSLPDCGMTNASFSGSFCPPTATNFSGITTGISGSPSGTVPFQIGNFIGLVNTTNHVFLEIGGTSGGVFDWGLPFFMGKNVYVGISGVKSSLGTGPYWSY